MSSIVAESDGEGLRTMGFSETRARRMTTAAGLSNFRVHDFDNLLNTYYEARV